MVYLCGVHTDHHHYHQQQQQFLHGQYGNGNNDLLRYHPLSSNGSFQFPPPVMINDNTNNYSTNFVGDSGFNPFIGNISGGGGACSNVASDWFLPNNHYAYGSRDSLVRNNPPPLNTSRSMAKVPKHDYEKTYEESDKRIKSSSCSLSSDDDDAKHEVIITGSTHKCNICEKEFSSGQALGGHKRSHPLKKIELETPSSPEISPEKRMKKSSFSLSSDEDDVKHEVSKHQCNICGKTFKNGKALGGHRRSHFIKKKLNHPENHVIRKSSSSSNYKSPTEHHKEDQAYGNFSLPKWQKKDRRGRKCIGSVEAAENLLLLRSDKYFCVGESSSNWNGKNELGGDRNSSDEQHKKGIFLFDLNESYAIED